MRLFSHTRRSGDFSLLLDIGSGSVGVAISRHVASGDPEIIWTHREYALIKPEHTAGQSLREINTCIVNALVQLGSIGLRQLRMTHPAATLSVCHVAISAPWSYTVSRTIKYKQEKPFRITDELLAELTAAADKKALELSIKQAILKENGLVTIEKQTIGVAANGYPLTDYTQVTTEEIELTHLTGMAGKQLMQTIEESVEKVVPHVTITPHVFTYVYFTVMRALRPHTSESCLVDVTSEATEMSILRDNLLTYSSHVSLGTYDLARQVSAALGVPPEEAYAFIRTSDDEQVLEASLTKTQQNALAEVWASYEHELTKLFQQTGDTLAVPKTLYLHADSDSLDFLKQRLRRAARAATTSEHIVYTVTPALLSNAEVTVRDTAILLLAQYVTKHVKTS